MRNLIKEIAEKEKIDMETAVMMTAEELIKNSDFRNACVKAFIEDEDEDEDFFQAASMLLMIIQNHQNYHSSHCQILNNIIHYQIHNHSHSSHCQILYNINHWYAAYLVGELKLTKYYHF